MIITHTPCVTRPFSIYEKTEWKEREQKQTKKCRLILIHDCTQPGRIYYACVRHPAVAPKLLR